MHKVLKWVGGALVGTGAVLAAHGALAQNSPGASTVPPVSTAVPRSGPLPAPVGHRQVRPSDLPADTVKSENKPEQGPGQGLRDLDAKLRICKGC